jgi:hypothetical protein
MMPYHIGRKSPSGWLVPEEVGARRAAHHHDLTPPIVRIHKIMPNHHTAKMTIRMQSTSAWTVLSSSADDDVCPPGPAVVVLIFPNGSPSEPVADAK